MIKRNKNKKKTENKEIDETIKKLEDLNAEAASLSRFEPARRSYVLCRFPYPYAYIALFDLELEYLNAEAAKM